MTDFDTLDNQNTVDESGYEGRLLARRYRVARKLGEGGMGMVYLAEDTELGDEKVAIKFIPPMLAGNARAIRNLKKEALTARQLSHPNIVRLHDLHTDGHQKFLVMEYIDGHTLDDVLAQRESESLAVVELVQMVEQLAAGLDYAHSKQVLHRDLKPSNIMVGSDGVVKLLDFGIAREIKDSYTRVTGNLTSGTLPYMSPEQLMGERPTIVMDVYSLGAVVYECLAGHPPFFMGDIRRQIEVKQPAPIESIPDHINQVLQQVLSKESGARPQSAGALVAMLKVQGHKGTKAQRHKGREAQTRVESIGDESDSRPPVEVPVADPTAQDGETRVRPALPRTEAESPAAKKFGPHAKSRASALLYPILMNGLAWGVGMSACTALGISLDRDGWRHEEITPLLQGLVGLWGGAATGFSLKLMGLVQRNRGMIVLALTWGIGWSLAAFGALYVGEELNIVPIAGLIVALTFAGSVAVLVRVLRVEGIRLSLRRRLALGSGWLLGTVIFGAITGGVGSLLDNEMGMREREAISLSSALGGLVFGVMSVLLLQGVTKGARRQSAKEIPKSTHTKKSLAPDARAEKDPPLDAWKAGGLLWPIVQSALMWSIGMGSGMSLWIALDHGSRWRDEEIAPLVISLWGLWGGMTTGLTLKLMGSLLHYRGLIILSLAWGTVWASATFAGTYAGEELDSAAGVVVIIAVAFTISVALLVLVLRLDGIRLSKPRRVLLWLGWLMGGAAHCLIWIVVGSAVFADQMRMKEQEAFPLSAALGGLVLGSIVVFLMKGIVKQAKGTTRWST